MQKYYYDNSIIRKFIILMKSHIYTLSAPLTSSTKVNREQSRTEACEVDY